jgi:hypothetical protein
MCVLVIFSSSILRQAHLRLHVASTVCGHYVCCMRTYISVCECTSTVYMLVSCSGSGRQCSVNSPRPITGQVLLDTNYVFWYLQQLGITPEVLIISVKCECEFLVRLLGCLAHVSVLLCRYQVCKSGQSMLYGIPFVGRARAAGMAGAGCDGGVSVLGVVGGCVCSGCSGCVCTVRNHISQLWLCAVCLACMYVWEVCADHWLCIECVRYNRPAEHYGSPCSAVCSFPILLLLII